MTAASPIKTRLSPHELATLTTLSNILHLAHHRNKNQHRRSHWYRPFSLLRRHLSRLSCLHSTLHSVPDTHAARHRKLAADRSTLAAALAESVYLADVLLPRCERAFGQLVAEHRYAVLGVVLFAVLGQLCGLLGVTAAVSDAAEREARAVLERFERDTLSPGPGTEAGQRTGSVGRERTAIMGDCDRGKEDQGVVVARIEDTMDNAEAAVPVPRPQSPARPPKRKSKEHDQHQKRRRKSGSRGDAIDDLFNGL